MRASGQTFVTSCLSQEAGAAARRAYSRAGLASMMLHPHPDLLLRIAQGDACGMATEFVDDRRVREVAMRLDAYCQHPTFLDVRAGHYTDDTQMSIAVAEVLLAEDPPTKERFADA